MWGRRAVPTLDPFPPAAARRTSTRVRRLRAVPTSIAPLIPRVSRRWQGANARSLRDQRRSPSRAVQSTCIPSPIADHSTSLAAPSSGATRAGIAVLVTSYSRALCSSHGLTPARLPQNGRRDAWQYALWRRFSSLRPRPPGRSAWRVSVRTGRSGDGHEQCRIRSIAALVLSFPAATIDSRRAIMGGPRRCDVNRHTTDGFALPESNPLLRRSPTRRAVLGV
jgi:hypothetical protein